MVNVNDIFFFRKSHINTSHTNKRIILRIPSRSIIHPSVKFNQLSPSLSSRSHVNARCGFVRIRICAQLNEMKWNEKCVNIITLFLLYIGSYIANLLLLLPVSRLLLFFFCCCCGSWCCCCWIGSVYINDNWWQLNCESAREFFLF